MLKSTFGRKLRGQNYLSQAVFLRKYPYFRGHYGLCHLWAGEVQKSRLPLYFWGFRNVRTVIRSQPRGHLAMASSSGVTRWREGRRRGGSHAGCKHFLPHRARRAEKVGNTVYAQENTAYLCGKAVFSIRKGGILSQTRMFFLVFFCFLLFF